MKIEQSNKIIEILNGNLGANEILDLINEITYLKLPLDIYNIEFDSHQYNNTKINKIFVDNLYFKYEVELLNVKKDNKILFEINNGVMMINKNSAPKELFITSFLNLLPIEENVDFYKVIKNNIVKVIENTNLNLTDELKDFLEEQGYNNIVEVDGWGICCLNEFVFTTGLLVGVTKDSYKKRYCYEYFDDALEALDKLNKNDLHPKGPWIKSKSIEGEELNPEIFNKNEDKKNKPK